MGVTGYILTRFLCAKLILNWKNSIQHQRCPQLEHPQLESSSSTGTSTAHPQLDHQQTFLNWNFHPQLDINTLP
jgi:hypothetical protein